MDAESAKTKLRGDTQKGHIKVATQVPNLVLAYQGGELTPEMSVNTATTISEVAICSAGMHVHITDYHLVGCVSMATESSPVVLHPQCTHLYP